MDKSTAQIARGWSVVGSDGAKIGEVVDTHEDHVVVTSGTLFKHKLYIPIDHLAQAGDGTVAVSIPAGQVDQEGWRFPPNAGGFQHEAPAYPEVPDTTMIEAAGYSAGRLSAPEPQGAVLNDGGIDPTEVPNADLGPDDAEREAPERDADVR